MIWLLKSQQISYPSLFMIIISFLSCLVVLRLTQRFLFIFSRKDVWEELKSLLMHWLDLMSLPLNTSNILTLLSLSWRNHPCFLCICAFHKCKFYSLASSQTSHKEAGNWKVEGKVRYFLWRKCYHCSFTRTKLCATEGWAVFSQINKLRNFQKKRYSSVDMLISLSAQYRAWESTRAEDRSS